MGQRGRGGYARGYWSLGICERCSVKMLRRLMVYDGQFPDLLVCSDCWDPKHPQEYLPPVTDPIVIYDPTGDPDKVQASTLVLTWPFFDGTSMPLSVSVTINRSAVSQVDAGGGEGAFDPDAFSSSAFDADAFFLG